MKKKSLILAVMTAFLLTGCADEVITVAGTIDGEEQEGTSYIKCRSLN